MPYYNLTVSEKTLSAAAANRSAALLHFEQEIGKKLTLEDQGGVPEHLMDEWTESPHWVHPTIPVWEKRDA